MFEWLKKLYASNSAQEPIAPPKQPPMSSREPEKPRTLMAALLANEHLERPLLFEPALRQFSAYRAGEPVFASEAQGRRWYALRSQVLQHVLLQICHSTASEHLLLRGSVLMSIWFGAHARRPGDLDWVVIPEDWDFRSNEAFDLIETIENSLKGTTGLADVERGTIEFAIPDQEFASDDIWMYEKAPGKRLIVPWKCDDAKMNGTLQMDLVFGEIIPSEPSLVNIATHEMPVLQVVAASVEQSLAWKLMWLETDAYGQGKDLYDAVLLAESCSLEPGLLQATFHAGDTLCLNYRDPLEKFDADTIRNWNIEWNDFKKEYPAIQGSEMHWKERLIKALEAFFEQLHRRSS